ncbi:MAG: glucuronate isomerase [Gemmatimonadaceae bacterium]
MEAGGVTPLHEDRYFDPDPVIRRHARELYNETCTLPIVSPHGHVDPAILAKNDPFADPASLIVTPDHYILRMLYSRGVPLESLGVRRLHGSAAGMETDPRKIWQTFADNWHLFRATPTRAWLEYELGEVFRIKENLDSGTAQRVYDAINERLRSPEFRPLALLQKFNIEVLATTDAPADKLEHHQALREMGLATRVIPTFRPDRIFGIAGPGWPRELERFEDVIGHAIRSGAGLVEALARRRIDFKAMGATATDHAVVNPNIERLSESDADRLFAKACDGKATTDDESRFEANLLMEMARLSTEDGLVMQIHAGAVRNHDRRLYHDFGPDLGGDIPQATEFTMNLQPLLNAYGNDPRFRLIVFTLDESTYSRELAPLAGHYQSMLLGAPWWFHDSVEGMRRFRESTTETAGIENTAGFADDTRAFCSIPARHDLARRQDANYLGGLVARHIIDVADARQMARALAYNLAKHAYRLDEEENNG